MVAGFSDSAEYCSENPVCALQAQTDPILRACICKSAIHVFSCQLGADRRASKPWLFWPPWKSLLPVL